LNVAYAMWVDDEGDASAVDRALYEDVGDRVLRLA